MKVKIVDIFEFYVLIEYEDNKLIQKKLIPREYYADSVKNITVEFSRSVISKGMEFSDVDLEVVLGEEYMGIQVAKIQDSLRRAGLWKREDYRRKPKTVGTVCRQFPGLDATTVLNAASYFDKGDSINGGTDAS